MEHFSLQILQQNIVFTARGLFNFDLTIVYSSVISGASYLIMLFQFEIAERLVKK